MVAHTFNPSTWETEAGGFLSSRPARNRVSSRTARATQRNPVSKNKQNKQRPKKQTNKNQNQKQANKQTKQRICLLKDGPVFLNLPLVEEE
jgi:cell division protein FtsB